MSGFRFSIRNATNDLYPYRGLALTSQSGSLGSTYGEDGKDMFFTIIITFILWTVRFNFYWKKI